MSQNIQIAMIQYRARPRKEVAPITRLPMTLTIPVWIQPLKIPERENVFLEKDLRIVPILTQANDKMLSLRQFCVKSGKFISRNLMRQRSILE
jgi:hypothetical protein